MAHLIPIDREEEQLSGYRLQAFREVAAKYTTKENMYDFLKTNRFWKWFVDHGDSVQIMARLNAFATQKAAGKEFSAEALQAHNDLWHAAFISQIRAPLQRFWIKREKSLEVLREIEKSAVSVEAAYTKVIDALTTYMAHAAIRFGLASAKSRFAFALQVKQHGYPLFAHDLAKRAAQAAGTGMLLSGQIGELPSITSMFGGPMDKLDALIRNPAVAPADVEQALKTVLTTLFMAGFMNTRLVVLMPVRDSLIEYRMLGMTAYRRGARNRDGWLSGDDDDDPDYEDDRDIRDMKFAAPLLIGQYIVSADELPGFNLFKTYVQRLRRHRETAEDKSFFRSTPVQEYDLTVPLPVDHAHFDIQIADLSYDTLPVKFQKMYDYKNRTLAIAKQTTGENYYRTLNHNNAIVLKNAATPDTDLYHQLWAYMPAEIRRWWCTGKYSDPQFPMPTPEQVVDAERESSEQRRLRIATEKKHTLNSRLSETHARILNLAPKRRAVFETPEFKSFLERPTAQEYAGMAALNPDTFVDNSRGYGFPDTVEYQLLTNMNAIFGFNRYLPPLDIESALRQTSKDSDRLMQMWEIYKMRN